MKKISTTQKIALGGLGAALSSVVMLTSNLFEAGVYALPAAAGIIIYFLSFVTGKRYAMYSYAATSVLALILCTFKEAAFCYILLFGYYPMMRDVFGRIKNRLLRVLLRLVYFNAAAGVILLLTFLLFGIDPENYEFFGMYLPAVYYLVMNVTFLIYDYTLYLFNKNNKPMIIAFVGKLLK